jgi:predicted phage tail protein
MRVIRLNGELGKRFGRVHKLDVRTPAEAVRALCANFEGFEQFIATSHKQNVAYRCVVDRDPLDEAHIGYPMSKSFSITPVVHGGGKVLGIILGAVLLVTAFALAPVTGGQSLVAAMQAAPAILGQVAWLGAALVLGGIASLLVSTPKVEQKGKTDENQYFNGPVNTTLQGGVVPIGYGRAVVGSAVISAAITIEQKPNPLYAYDIGFTGFAKQ